MGRQGKESGKEGSAQGAGRVSRHMNGGGTIWLQAWYALRVSRAMERAKKVVNAVGWKYRNNTLASRAGHVTEAIHAESFNISSACNRSRYIAVRDDSRKFKSPDIVIKKGKEIVQRVSVKNYRNPARAARAQQGYGDQARLVPPDQLGQVNATVSAEIDRLNRMGPTADQEHMARLQEVKDNAVDAVRAGGNESTPLTHAESLELAEKAKDGKITVKDVAGPTGKRLWQGAKSGAKYGAAFAGGVALVGSVWGAVRECRAGKPTNEVVRDVFKEVVTESLEGAVTGAIGGVVTTGAQLLSAALKNGLGKRALGGALPATLALLLYEASKDTVRCKQGAIDSKEMKRRAKLNVSNAGAGLLGVQLGMIAGPFGSLALGILLPMLVSWYMEQPEVSLAAPLQLAAGPALELPAGLA